MLQSLIDSLDQDEIEEPGEVERAWAAELELRAALALESNSSAKHMDDVFADLEAKYPAKK